MLYEAASSHFKPIILCAYLTGMRRSEIARLRWQDIDFEDRTLCIAETKNDRPRTIPMSESLFSTLQDMKMKSVSEFLQHQRVSPIPLFLHGKGLEYST